MVMGGVCGGGRCFPGPADTEGVDAWGDLLVVDAAMALAGNIPDHAVACGVRADGPNAACRVQLTEVTDADRADLVEMACYWDENSLEYGLALSIEVVDRPVLDGETRWVWVARGFEPDGGVP
jgi:hypothetical protein